MPVITTMPQRHFDTIIRLIKISNMERVKSLRTATHAALGRLRVKRDLDKAVGGVPKGSDQSDFSSIFCWMNKVDPNEAEAVAQVIAIDATAVVRMKG